MKDMPYADKMNMIKSQLKRFEIFQYKRKLFVKVPALIDLNNLKYKESDILFYTVDEIEDNNSISDDISILECDINKINGENLLNLIAELNMLYRREEGI